MDKRIIAAQCWRPLVVAPSTCTAPSPNHGCFGSAIFASTGSRHASEAPASGTPTPSTPGQNGAGVLRQGYVETSNVNVAEELVTMIQTQRAYELNSKVVSTSDAMLGRLTQL